MKRTKWIALLAAFVATFAVWQILSGLNMQKEAEMDYREVVVAGAEIAKGDVIPQGKVEIKKVPRQYTPENALEEGKDAVGMVALSDIAAGEIVTPKRLTSPDSGMAGLSYKIPEGLRAVTLTSSVESGVAGLILPGNEVDILITLSRQPGETGTAMEGAAETEPMPEPTSNGNSYSSFYLLEKVQVLACGTKMSADEVEKAAQETGQMYDSVTLAVTPEDAKQLELYTHMAKQAGGNIRMTLRPSEGEAGQEKAGEGNTEEGGPEENDTEEQGE